MGGADRLVPSSGSSSLSCRLDWRSGGGRGPRKIDVGVLLDVMSVLIRAETVGGMKLGSSEAVG